MTVSANPIDGALVRPDGTLSPRGNDDASAEGMRPPDGMVMPPTPIAMTNGRQMSAARSN